MAYRIVVFSRFALTLICKATAAVAAATRLSPAVSALDILLRIRGRVLWHEAVLCMGMTRKWQKRAERCVIAHHEFERVMGGGK